MFCFPLDFEGHILMRIQRYSNVFVGYRVATVLFPPIPRKILVTGAMVREQSAPEHSQVLISMS